MGRATAPEPRYLSGNVAAAEGAVAAGCDFYAGYPITPSSEVMEHLAARFHELGRTFVQMEDEIGSICAAIGAAWAGARAMTATSGPGMSLMMEALGYAAFTETPLVIVDVQRAGPCTGQATRTGAGDVMQVKWGSHGDIQPVALSPWSVQEMFSLTARAFDLAERLRVPVVVLAEEAVGHLRERVELPATVAVAAASRCLAVRSCEACDLCRLLCPDLAITRCPDTGRVRIDLDYCKGCGICAAFCPRGAIRMEPEPAG